MNGIELITNKKGLGTFKVPRVLAQGTYKISEKHRTKINRNGAVFYRNPTTIVDEKISDTCIQIFQDSDIAKQFEYEDLREKAEEALEKKFKKYGLLISDKKTKEQNLEIEKKIEIAIHQWIRNYIEENLTLKFETDFDSFIEKTGVKTAKYKTHYALKMLKDIKNKASYEYKVPILNDDFSEISYEFKSVAAIPEITLVLDEEMGEKYKTLTEFAEADIKNKKKHIQKISFEISKSYLSAVIGLGKDYTNLNRKERVKFTSSYSFRLDTRLKSIAKVQHNKSFNSFTFEEIQSVLGTSISEYRFFKKNVLMPAIKDLNQYTNYNVELIEQRENNNSNGKICSISFLIKSKDKEDKNLKFGIDKIAYYIASRMYYFSNSKIKNLMWFAKDVEKNIKESELTIYLDKFVTSWKEEAEKEYEIEKELITFMEDNRRTFELANIVYDEKRLCIVEKNTILESTKENPNIPKGIDKIELESVDGEIKDKITMLKTSNYLVTNPSTSLRYIHDVVLKNLPKEQSIPEFIPFYISTGKGFVEIDNFDAYIKHKSTIEYHIVEKNLSFFRFEEDHLLKDIFYSKVLEGSFKEITADLRDMVKKLTGAK